MRSGLESLLGDGSKIQKIRLMRGDIRFKIPKNLPEKLSGATITSVRRRAKYLFFETPNGALLSHLGMTGSWRVERTSATQADLDKHDHVFVDLSDGRTLVFRDPRRFGVIDFIKPGDAAGHKLLKHLGPEPLDADSFNGESLHTRSRHRKIAVKVFIMDQKIVVGVGNIYASEALFRAKINPRKAAGRLTRNEADRIVLAIRDVLTAAIRAGGSSIRDYRQASGESGAFQDSHLVYDRKGRPCSVCGTPIRSRVMGGRSTYWCPTCQK